MVAVALFLVGALGLSVGHPLDENPLHRCQEKKRGETPFGFTNETWKEKETECIYFCKPEFYGEQWFIGAIQDGTECKTPAGEAGTCKGGYCIVEKKEEKPAGGEKVGPGAPPSSGSTPAPGNEEEVPGGSEGPEVPENTDNTSPGPAESEGTEEPPEGEGNETDGSEPSPPPSEPSETGPPPLPEDNPSLIDTTSTNAPDGNDDVTTEGGEEGKEQEEGQAEE